MSAGTTCSNGNSMHGPCCEYEAKSASDEKEQETKDEYPCTQISGEACSPISNKFAAPTRTLRAIGSGGQDYVRTWADELVSGDLCFEEDRVVESEQITAEGCPIQADVARILTAFGSDHHVHIGSLTFSDFAACSAEALRLLEGGVVAVQRDHNLCTSELQLTIDALHRKSIVNTKVNADLNLALKNLIVKFNVLLELVKANVRVTSSVHTSAFVEQTYSDPSDVYDRVSSVQPNCEHPSRRHLSPNALVSSCLITVIPVCPLLLQPPHGLWVPSVWLRPLDSFMVPLRYMRDP